MGSGLFLLNLIHDMRKKSLLKLCPVMLVSYHLYLQLLTSASFSHIYSHIVHFFFTPQGAYVNFHPISAMDQAYSIILGTAGFLSTLKINILLSFDKRFTQLKRTMVYAQKDLLAFGVYFFIILFAFVSVNSLVLGPLVEDYNGVLKTMQTLLVSETNPSDTSVRNSKV